MTVEPAAKGETPKVITYQFKLEYARGMGVDQISPDFPNDPIGNAESAGFGGFQSLSIGVKGRVEHQ